MSEIYIEVSETTNMAMVCIPYGMEEKLWQFHVVFTELDHLRTRIVTVIDNNGGSEQGERFKNKVVTNEDYRMVDFDYESENDDVKMKVKLSVFFSRSIRMIKVSW